MERFAVLDLGTNTFNLLIVEGQSGSEYSILVNQKLPVKLGEDRINDGEIIPKAFKRGIEAVKSHFTTIKNYHVKNIRAYGTSALRSAKNGEAFMEEVSNVTEDIEIEIISGDREAELIYLGVKQTLKNEPGKFLILDIGGGSNELVIADMEKIHWKKSYPLGIARLLEKFSPSDPATKDEIIAINQYLAGETRELFEMLGRHSVATLIGASGSFETFIAMINGYDATETESAKNANALPIELTDFHFLYNKLIKSSVEERKKMKGLEPMRIEMIVLASLFVKFILENFSFNRLMQSNFALKEGAIYELLNLNT